MYLQNFLINNVGPFISFQLVCFIRFSLDFVYWSLIEVSFCCLVDSLVCLFLLMVNTINKMTLGPL